MKPRHGHPGDDSTRRLSRRGFAVRVGDIKHRADVGFAAGSKRVKTLYANPKFSLQTLGSFARAVQYGTSALASVDRVGTPVLRMNNIQEHGWDLSDIKYIDMPESELASYLLTDGDILFTRTNGSKDLVGKCEVFREQGDWVFASYLIRLQLDESKALPDFISGFLNTNAGRAQVERVSRQILMSNINAEEIRNLLIPLPPLDVQRSMVESLLEARDSRDRKLVQADELLQGLDDYLLTTLGLTATPEVGRGVFAVRLKELRGKRLDPPAYRPLLVKGKAPRIRTKPLAEVARIDSNTLSKRFKSDTLVPYIGLPECSQTEVKEVALRPYSEVKGRGIVRTGDILFARIEPSVFNKKYVLVDDLRGHDFAFTSTEFYTVRAIETEVIQEYLYAMMFCSFVFAQVKGKTTGSSGRRRIDSDLFAELQIPVAGLEVQQTITTEVMRRRESANEARQTAASEWAAAKAHFEGQLLGGGKSR